MMRPNILAIVFLLFSACGHAVLQQATPPVPITLEQKNLHGNFPRRLLGVDVDAVEPELQSTVASGLRLVTLPADRIPVTGYHWLFSDGNNRDAGILFGRTLLQDPSLKDKLRQLSMTFAVDSHDGYFLISGRLPSTNLAGGMELLVHSLKEAGLKKEFFSGALRETRINDIISGRDIFTQMLNTLYQRLYPAGHPIRNRYSSVRTDKVDLQDIKNFYREKIGLAGSTLILQSDRTHEQLADLLANAVESLSWSGPAQTPDTRIEGDSKRNFNERRRPIIHIVNRPGSVQSGIGLGWLTVDVKHEDYPALVMFSMVMTDRLFRDVRETHGWTYSISATQQASAFTAPFVVLTSCSNRHTAACLSAVLKHVSYGCRELIGDDELAEVKNRAIADMNRDLDNPAWMGLQIAQMGGVAPFRHWYQNLVEAFRSLTAEDMRQSVAPYFEQNPVIVILGDKDIIKSYISQYFPEYSIQ